MGSVEKKSTTGYCYIVTVYVLLHAIITFLLIFWMVQQQREVEILRELLNNHVHQCEIRLDQKKQLVKDNNEIRSDTMTKRKVAIIYSK